MLLMDDKLDAMTEVVNIGVGRAAASLSELLGSRIELHVPELRVLGLEEANRLYGGGVSVVQGFHGQINGNALLVFPIESGRQLASLMMGDCDPDSLQSYEVSGILSEVGNIVLNGVMGSIANVINDALEYEVPQFYVDRELSQAIEDSGNASGQVLMADTTLVVNSEKICGKVLIAFRVGSIEAVLCSLGL